MGICRRGVGSAIVHDRNNASALAFLGFYKMFLGHSRGWPGGGRDGVAFKPARSERNVVAIRYVPPPLPSCALGTSDPMVRQVDRQGNRRWPYAGLAAANAWLGRTRRRRRPPPKCSKSIPTSPSRVGWGPLDRRSDLQRAKSAHRRRLAQGRYSRGGQEDELNWLSRRALPAANPFSRSHWNGGPGFLPSDCFRQVDAWLMPVLRYSA